MRRTAATLLLTLLAPLLPGRASAECIAPPPSCNLLNDSDVIFTGTLVADRELQYHFRVSERFKGRIDAEVDVFNMVYEGFPGFAGVGKDYLVFADHMPGEGSLLRLTDCGRNMIVRSHAGGLIEQLRRQRRGSARASLYGTVNRGGWPYDRDAHVSVPGIVIRAKSAKGTVQTRAGADGSYAFDRLPSGQYVFEVDAPAHSTLESLEPVQVGPNQCVSQYLTLVPDTRISGRVLTAEGEPLPSAQVTLVPADRYGVVGESLGAWQRDGRPFEFTGIRPGDYLLAYGDHEGRTFISADAPFAPAFYPSSPDAANASVIHLGESEQAAADVRLAPALPVRHVTIQIEWNGRTPSEYFPPQVYATSSIGSSSARRNDDGTYTLPLLRDVPYLLRGTLVCRGRGLSEAERRDIAVGQAGVMTLVFPPGECTK